MEKTYKLQLDYMPQHEWSEAPMWLEMSFGAIGGGLFIVSALLNSIPGAIAGLLLAVVGKGPLLLVDLGRPLRFLRVLTRPHKSWISFGAWTFLFFGVCAPLYAALALAGDHGGFTGVVKYAAILTAAVLIVYDGFFMGAAAGVAAWHSSILPLLFGTSALSSGAVTTLVLQSLMRGGQSPAWLVNLILALFVVLAFATYSYVTGIARSVQSAQVSARELVSGELKPAFVYGAVIVGVAVPLAISGLCVAGIAISLAGWVVAAACAGVGIVCLRYSVLKAGVYAPVA